MHPALLGLLLIPLLGVCIDTVAAVRAQSRAQSKDWWVPCEDFTVLVPIYGDIRYLENVDFLAAYGGRVTLCTTAGESAQFMADLDAVSDRHGFAISVTEVAKLGASGKRATSGPTRDTLVADVLTRVQTEYVVCLDADTVTRRPIGELIGEMVARDLDVASIRLVPSNTDRWLGKIQAHEYRISMEIRRIMPWLVSGACHALRTEVHRDLMNRHSFFFQGDDVELGVLAQAAGYRVGHVIFEVPTTVPDTLHFWLRQRLAWAGGEFRLFVVNVHLIRRHPFLWFYGLGIVLIGTPWRWFSLVNPGWALAVMALMYLAMAVVLNREHLDRWVLLIPLYSGLSSLVLTPIGVFIYIRMALADRNPGFIRVNRSRSGSRHAVLAAG